MNDDAEHDRSVSNRPAAVVVFNETDGSPISAALM